MKKISQNKISSATPCGSRSGEDRIEEQQPEEPATDGDWLVVSG
jgi:hypothetical protein